MRIGITSTLDSLIADFAKAADEIEDELDAAAKDAAKDGNRIAKAYAKESAGAHGKRYSPTFLAARLGRGDYIYGPTGTVQGDMSFETGSRKQPPHLDLAKSADRIAPWFVDRCRRAIGKVSL